MLHHDFIDDLESWENNTLSRFLDALSRYASDLDGYYQNIEPNENADNASWKRFADIFKRARIYE